MFGYRTQTDIHNPKQMPHLSVERLQGRITFAFSGTVVLPVFLPVALDDTCTNTQCSSNHPHSDLQVFQGPLEAKHFGA